ncbi:MAG: PKD domain-containing protein [Bacteroidia bacterium]
MNIFTKKKNQHLFKTISVFILTLLAFPSLAVDYYWVGGTGSWTSPSTHWATTSGGSVFHPSVPSQFDRVIFDANSFSASGQEVTMNSEGFCLEFRSKDVRSGVKFTSSKQLNVYNGFSIDSNLIFNQTGFLNIIAGGFTIGKNTSFTVNGNITLTAGNFIIQRQTTFYQNGTFNITLGNFNLASKTTYTQYGDMNMNNGSFTMGDSITWIKNNSINQNRGDFRIGTDNNFVVNSGNILNDVNGDFYIGARTTFNLNCCTMRTAGHLYIDNSSIINTNSAMQIGIGDLVLDSGTRWTCTNQLYIVNGSLIVKAGARFTQHNNTIISGSLDIDSAAIVAGSTQYYMRGAGAGLYVKSGNRDLRRMQFDGSNGQYTFMDDVTLSSDGLYMYGAGNSINFNGKKVNVYNFYQWDGNVFSMNLTGTDTIKVKREFRIYSSVNITGNPVIYFDGSDNFYFNSNNNKVFDKVYMKAQNTGGSQIQYQSISNIKSVEIIAYGTQPLYFENVTIRNFNLNYLQNTNASVNTQFSNAAHIDTLNITSSFNIKTNLITNGNNYLGIVNIPKIIQWTIQSSNTQTLVSINPLTGTCGAEILVNSNNPGTAGTISMATDTLKGNWLKIQDCIGTGGAVFMADNTVNFGNVTGWAINSIPPRDFYWVGGTGNWNDASHWSLTSGGTPVGCALPNKSDNVFFDTLSFSASGQSVTVNVTADVNNFTVGNIIQGARFMSGSELYVYGSLVLNRKMSYELNSNLNFVSADTNIKTIFTDSVKLRQVYFGRNTSSNNARWMLLDNFNNNDNFLYMQYGKLITNGKNIRTYAFYAWDGGNKNIDWTGTDTVQVQYQFYANPNSFPWTSRPNILIFESSNHFYLMAGNHTFNDVIFNAKNTGGSLVEINYNIIARDITINAYGYQWMNLYSQFTARDFTFRYLNANNSNQTLDFQTNNPSTFRSVKIYGSGLQRPNVYFRYNTTADTLIFNTLNELYFQGGYTKTVKKYMSVQGACDNRFAFRCDGTNTAILADTGAILNADWVNMTNIKVQGVGTFTGTNILNLGGNIGWNINAVPTTNFYWVGGTGNWNDKNHWALTSGGTPGACPIPSQTDNVFFDVNSFTAANQTVTINTTANCLSMSWNNVNFPRINGGNELNIYGSMTLDSKLSWQHSGWTYFRSNITGNTVNTKGILLTNIQYLGTGEWTLGDNLRATHVYVNSGSFISGGKTITLSGNFYCWTGAITSVNLTGTDTITVGNEFRIYTNNFTLNMGNAVVKFAGTNNFYFNGGNKTYTDLVFNADNTGNSTIQLEHNNTIRNLKINAAGYQIINMVSSSTYNDVTMLFRNPSNNNPTVNVNGNNTFNDMTITSIGTAGPFIYLNNSNTYNNLIMAGVGTRIFIGANQTQTVKDALALGSGGFPVFLQSNSAGTQGIISKPTGSVCMDYIWLRDVRATGGASFNAGSTSVNLGNNTNWSFTSCAGYYWVGGTGNWSDYAHHWAYSSGGSILHNTPPNQFDDVFFDANSFTTAGEVITIDDADPKMHNLSFASALYTPTLTGNNLATQMNVYGSLKLITNMNQNFTGEWNFMAPNDSNDINTAGKTLQRVNFKGGNSGQGGWVLQNNLTVSDSINLNNGRFRLNGKEVITKYFNTATTNTRILDLGSSLVNIIDGEWNPSNLTNLTFIKGTSEIIVKGTSNSNFYGNGLTYNKVTFRPTTTMNSLLTGANTYAKLRFEGGVNASLEPVIQNATAFEFVGSCAKQIGIQSTSLGNQSTFRQTSGTVAASFINVKDNATTGGATFNANQSNDLGNNAGWSFTSAPTITISANSGLVNCSANNDGWAKVSVLQGTSPFTYLWSTNETTDSISHLIPGIYTVTVRDSNGCAATDAVSVVNLPSALTPVNWNASAFDVCQGTTINFTPNEVSTAMHFDGTNDYVRMPHNAVLNTTNLTVEAWIKADPTQTDYATIVDNGSDTLAGNGWSLQFNGSTGNVRFWNANGIAVSATNLKDNQWHHLAGTYDGINFKIYVDGTQENSIPSGSGIVNSSDDLFVGNSSQGSMNFKGLIDEVRVWNVAKTDVQIQAKRNSDLVGNESGLVAYYNMEYNVGTSVLKDLTSNTNNGVITNMDSTTDWVNPGAVNSTITYVWNFGDFTTSVLKTPTKSYSTAGTYTVSLGTYDKNGCPNFVTKTVRVSQVAFTVVKTNILCRGNDNGTISVSAAGGISPFTYSINNGGTYGSSPSFTGLGAATYQVIAKDSIGCTAAVQNFTVTQPGSALAFSVVQNSPICLSTTDGTITVTATGGSAPYQYSKNAGIAYQSANAFSLLTAGTYTLRVRDANNCVAADQVITITEVDSTKPVFTACPSNITANAGSNCNAVVTYSLPTATDNCKVPSVILTQGLASGAVFPKGITTVSYLANDSNGNTRTCTFTVNVVDVTAPNIIRVNNSAPLNSSGTVTISPSLINNGSFDNCGIDSIKVYPSTFTCANKGNNTVTLWVRDSSGNIATQTATVNVQDLIAPELTCKIDTAVLDINGNVTITSSDVVLSNTDNCGIPTIGLSKTSFNATNIGSNSILVTSTDASNNVTTCSTTVVVIEPSPNAICRNATIYLNNAGNATIIPSDLDNGSNSSIGISSRTLSKSSFDCSNIGTNADTLTVYNSFGRSAYCIATVTVLDTIKPNVITQNINVYLNSNGTASILPAHVNNGSNDACGILSTSVSPNSFTCANRGSNTVYLTVTDVNGNVNIGAATVTIIDTIKPTVITQNITVNLDTLGSASITPSQINNGSFDNCTIENLGLSKTTFNCSNVGANTVFLTVTDSSGNSSTDSAIVTIVAPNGLPNFTTSKLSYNGVDLTCFGTSDGEITIAAVSGTIPYTYSKDNGSNYQTSNVFGGLPENSYMLKVMDKIGCVSTVSTVNIIQTAPLSGTANTNAPICALTQLDLSATILGGTGARTYSWTGPNNYVSDTTNLPSTTVSNAALLNMNGVYSVKVTDTNNCVYIPSISVIVNPIPLATIVGANSVCKDAPTPLVTLIGSNGTAPFTFIYSVNNVFDTITTVSGNSIDVAVPTNVAGTFIYKLLSVRDSSSTTCLGAANDSVILVIRPKPLFSATAAPIANTICEGTSTTISCTNATTSLGSPNYVVAESNNFSAAVGSNWSFQTVSPVNVPTIQTYNGQNVLGYLGNQQATYNLTSIPNHDSIKIDFDLYIHDTWDGNNGNSTPDLWKMGVDGTNIINTTFSNISWNTQAYPSNIPANNSIYSGSVTNNLPPACNIGGGAPTTKYHISKVVSHTANSMSLVLEALNLENLCNESWSIDNFEVQYRFISSSTNFVWNSPVSSNNSITVSPIVNTYYVATLGTCSDSIEIIVNPTPRADFTINTNNQCLAGNSFNFTNNTILAGGGAMTYVWTMAGASTTTDTSTNIIGNTYSVNGSYNVNLVATSVIGNCTDSRGNKTKATSVNPPAIVTSSVPNPICAGTVVRLTANQIVGSQNSVSYSNFYSNNFETAIDSTLFTFTTDSTLNIPTIKAYNGENILGYLTNQKVIYNQSALPTHQYVKIDFDLYLHDSWDGNSLDVINNILIGKDIWKMDVNGNNIMNTTFSNFSYRTQAYPNNLPTINNAFTGSTATNLPNVCNFSGGATTSKYHISKSVPHTANSLNVVLEALGLENICNESWSIDNFAVQVGINDVSNVLANSCNGIGTTPILWNGGSANGDTTCYVDVMPDSTNNYSVSIGGCASQTYAVNVSPTPVPAFALTNSSCSKEVAFTNDNVEPNVTYTWNFGDNSTNYIGETAPNHTYASGTYTVTLTAAFGANCARVLTKTITISDTPTASYSFVTGVGCGSNVQFTSTSSIPNGNTATYLWNFGETPIATTSTSQNPLKNYTNAGSYTVQLTVSTGGNGCTSTTSQTVSVSAAPVGNEALFTASVGGACGNLLTTTNSSTGTGNIYLWNFGDGYTSSAVSPTHYYNEGGSKLITLTIVNGIGCAGTYTQTVVVSSNSGSNGRVGVDFNITPIATQVLLGNNFGFIPSFTNSQTNNPVLYCAGAPTWTYGDGTGSTYTNIYSKQYASAGSYTVRIVQLTTNTGCYAEASKTVTVLPNPLAVGQQLFNNYNQIGIEKASGSTFVNPVTNQPKSEISMYPNPNKGTFKVQVNNLNITHGDLIIVDMLGREVYKSTYDVKSKNDIVEVNGLNISSGTYNLVLSSNGVTHNRISFVIIAE